MSFPENRTENTTMSNIELNETLQKIYQVLDERLQITQEKPSTRTRIDVKLIKSTLTKNDLDNPSLIITNLKNKSKIREITLGFDAVFQSKGKIIITIDDVAVFTSKDLEAFTLASIQTINFGEKGLEIKRDVKIKFFVWNAVDGNEIRVTVSTNYSD